MKIENQYAMAVRVIREVSDRTQQKLDETARAANNAFEQAVRQAATDGVSVDSPAYLIASLVANTLTFSAVGEYPKCQVPDETRAIMVAAKQAGILGDDRGEIRVGKLLFTSDGSGTSNANNLPEWEVAYDAFKKTSEFRRMQTVKGL